jgi:hypothetical protein
MRFLQKNNIMLTTGISRRFFFEQPGFVVRVSLNSLIIRSFELESLFDSFVVCCDSINW